MIVKPYPKDDESPVRTLSQQLLDVAARIQALGLNRDDLLFPSPEASGGNPPSRNTLSDAGLAVLRT